MSNFVEEVAFNRGQYLEAIVAIIDAEPFDRAQRLGAIEFVIEKYKASEYYEAATEDGE